MKKFLFIDDHSMVRAGLITIFSSEYEDADYYEAENEKQAVALINKHLYSLIIMDINMPNSDSTQLLQSILAVQPNTPVLILSMNDEKNFAMRFFKLGSKGFVHKSADAGEILTAARTLLQNDLYMSDVLKHSLLQSYVNNANDNPFESLTEREFQVIRGLLMGRTIADIATDLNINISTVSTYKGKACEKLGVSRTSYLELHSLAKMHNFL